MVVNPDTARWPRRPPRWHKGQGHYRRSPPHPGFPAQNWPYFVIKFKIIQVWQLHVKKASLQIAWILQTQSIHSFHILKITHLCKLFLRYKSTTMSLVYENHPGKIYVNNDYEKYECEHLLCPCLPQISMKQRPEQPLLSRAHHPFTPSYLPRVSVAHIANDEQRWSSPGGQTEITSKGAIEVFSL